MILFAFFLVSEQGEKVERRLGFSDSQQLVYKNGTQQSYSQLSIQGV